MRIKISFDVDGTTHWNAEQFIWDEPTNRFLPNPDISKELIQFGQELSCNEDIELHIITRRYGTEKGSRVQVEGIAALLSIPLERIHYLSHAYKYSKIKELDIHIHIDDDILEDIPLINQRTSCKTVFVGDSEWKNTFKNLINDTKQRLLIG